MKEDQKGQIEYAKPGLVDLDGGEKIAGGSDCVAGEAAGSKCSTGGTASGNAGCMVGISAFYYCGSGTTANGSGCNEGTTVSCSVGHFV